MPLEKMKHWRKLALERLNPTEKELQHGLELHKESFVFDAYGFMPKGGGRNERLEKLIKEHASRDEIRLAHEEFIMCGSFEKYPVMKEKLAQAWDFAGVDCVFQNCGEEGNCIEQLLKRLSFYTYVTDLVPEVYERAVFPRHLEKLKEHSRRALYITTNGVPVPEHLYSAKDALSHIGVFAKLGVRMMHLTYNRRNLIGDGCAETSNAGLSDFGRMVIEEMNRCKVIPDVAHSGLRTSYEAAVVSRKPVVASHSVAGGLSTHYRSKSDEVIQSIKESGGYIGICAYPAFLQGSHDINALIDHVEYVARKFGVDHVAIGTDNGMNVAPMEMGELSMPVMPPIWEQYWRSREKDLTLEGMSQEDMDTVAWSNWPLFTVGLVQRGFSDDEIRKIIGGNVLRVCKETMEE